MARRKPETRIFFPWEHRGGWLRRLGLNRFRPFLVFAAVGLFTVLVGARERRQSGERRTRAIIEQYRGAIEGYLASHEGKCPTSLLVVKDVASIERAPNDAWGRPLRFACPWELSAQTYLLSSDGADGKPGGLDRIE